MKIAFLSQPRDRILGHGPETSSVATVLMALANRLARFADVTVVAPSTKNCPSEERLPSGVRIRRIPANWRRLYRTIELVDGWLNNTMPYSTSKSYFHGYAREAARILAEDPPDVVHLQTYPQFVPTLRQFLPRARFVLHLHDVVLLRLPRDRILPKFLEFDCVLCCSDWLSRELRASFPEVASKAHALPNAVDLDFFKPKIQRENADESLRLVYAGRVSPEKGVHVLLDAFRIAVEKYPHYSLDVFGEPGLLPYQLLRFLVDKSTLRSLDEFYGTNIIGRIGKQIVSHRSSYLTALRTKLPTSKPERVRFLGQVSQERLAEAYANSDVFVLPSVCDEGLSLPVLEAMASALPVVSVAANGPKDTVIDGETGFLVSRNNHQELSDALIRLAKDPGLRRKMGNAGRVRAANHFSWDLRIQNLVDIYDGLLTEPRNSI